MKKNIKDKLNRKALKSKVKFYTIFAIPLLIFAFLNTASADKIYRWTDSKGNIHYGDKDVKSLNSKDISNTIDTKNTYQFKRPSNIKNQPADKHNHGINVTKYIKRKDYITPFQFTAYIIQQPFLPEASLFDMARLKNSLWIASSRGLFQFDINDEDLFLYDETVGLPSDKVTDIFINKTDQMFLEVYYQGKNTSFLNGYYEYKANTNEYHAINKTINELKAGVNLTVKNSDILHNRINNILHYQGKVWLTSYGTKVTNNYSGGVAVLDKITKRGIQYRTREGLAHSYCYDITSSENNSVWITHWDKKRGLSVLTDNSKRWRNIKTSLNNIELGGVKIASAGQYILIGQQGALVIYDEKSKLAHTLTSNKDVANHVINDILVDDDFIWVTSHGLDLSGIVNVALIKIPRLELDKLFIHAEQKEAK